METHKPHWTAKQQARLRKRLGDPAWRVLFHCTDQHGFPANGGDRRVRNADMVTQLGMKGSAACGPGSLHATEEPHMWRGCRVWIVALRAARRVDEEKWATTDAREVIGEVLPEDCLDARVGGRVGVKDLSGANLTGADLAWANLAGANLCGANLSVANLAGANLCGANLSGDYLAWANLAGANLCGANLTWANLTGANLSGADLYGANLTGQNKADLIARGALGVTP